MVQEFYMDLRDTIDELKFPAKRCVQCGEVVDVVILTNRQQGQGAVPIQVGKKMPRDNHVTSSR